MERVSHVGITLYMYIPYIPYIALLSCVVHSTIIIVHNPKHINTKEG